MIALSKTPRNDNLRRYYIRFSIFFYQFAGYAESCGELMAASAELCRKIRDVKILKAFRSQRYLNFFPSLSEESRIRCFMESAQYFNDSRKGIFIYAERAHFFFRDGRHNDIFLLIEF